MEEFIVYALKECDDEGSIEYSANSELVDTEDDAQIDEDDVETDLWVVLCVYSAAEVRVEEVADDGSDVFATDPNLNWGYDHDDEWRFDEGDKCNDT